MRPRGLLLAAIGAIVLLNVILLSTPFGQLNYDTETHLFLADHYRQNWFSPWEVKWFDGMWVWSYPPLAHQLIALFGAAWDVDVGYKLLQGLSLVALPPAIWLFATEMIGRRYAGWAALLAAFVPGLYISLYSWGQLPSLVAMDLALVGLAFLARFLRSGRLTALAAWIALAGAAAAAHHHTVVFIMPVLAVAVVARHWRLRRVRRGLVRAALGGLGLVLAIVGALLPFWWWVLTYYQPQVELPHPSRGGLFDSPLVTELFLWGMYGGFALLAPFGLAAIWHRWRLWPLALAIGLLAVLGLGTLTPLPRILFAFQDLWQWLVYERFAVWAAVLSTLPASLVLQRLWRRRSWVVLGALSLILLVGVAREASMSLDQRLLPRPLEPWEETAILSFLQTDDHADWNYVTIGLGEAGLARLTRLTTARTFDGLYYTARQREELRNSGVGSFDAAYAWRTGQEIIPQVLKNPASWNLEWVILARPELQPQLHAAGWTLLTQLTPDQTVAALQQGPEYFFKQSEQTQAAFVAAYGDRAALAWAAEHAAELGPPAVYSRVSIWQAPRSANVPRLGPATAPPPYPALLPVLWGLVPLALLAVGLMLSLSQLGAFRHLVRAMRWPWSRGNRSRSGAVEAGYYARQL